MAVTVRDEEYVITEGNLRTYATTYEWNNYYSRHAAFRRLWRQYIGQNDPQWTPAASDHLSTWMYDETASSVVSNGGSGTTYLVSKKASDNLHIFSDSPFAMTLTKEEWLPVFEHSLRSLKELWSDDPFMKGLAWQLASTKTLSYSTTAGTLVDTYTLLMDEHRLKTLLDYADEYGKTAVLVPYSLQSAALTWLERERVAPWNDMGEWYPTNTMRFGSRLWTHGLTSVPVPLKPAWDKYRRSQGLNISRSGIASMMQVLFIINGFYLPEIVPDLMVSGTDNAAEKDYLVSAVVGVLMSAVINPMLQTMLMKVGIVPQTPLDKIPVLPNPNQYFGVPTSYSYYERVPASVVVGARLRGSHTIVSVPTSVPVKFTPRGGVDMYVFHSNVVLGITALPEPSPILDFLVRLSPHANARTKELMNMWVV